MANEQGVEWVIFAVELLRRSLSLGFTRVYVTFPGGFQEVHDNRAFLTGRTRRVWFMEQA